MNTITNLAAIVSSIIVTSYSTNVVPSDNAVRKSWQEPTFTLLYPPEANQRTVTATITPATERYERVTITEHKTAEIVLTNGATIRQELTNRVVSDRIRTWRIIQTEEFVDEKDVPKRSPQSSERATLWSIPFHCETCAWNEDEAGGEGKE